MLFRSPTIQSQMLAPDQALVEYFTRDTLVHIFVVRKDTFFHHSQPISADFDRMIADLDWNASAGKKDIAREQALCKTAYRLYQTLLAPVAHLLPERLIIIPDANLQSLPFETLITDAPTEGAGIAAQGQQQRFVLFKYVVSYCYSASLLYEMQRIDVAKGKKRRLVGFAPDFPVALHASNGLPQSIKDVLPVLRHLPNEEELEAINEKVCMERFVDIAATKGCFFNTCRDALAVHVATHGILVDDAPANNFIAFNQAQDTVNTSELLYLSELASQEPLNLELATFSACETARGKYVAGEGNMSMARALAAAGVKSILTTLWPVRTTQQARLMPVFYGQFTANGGADKDRALTLAKRDFILNSDAYPAAWAGTILIDRKSVV